MNGQAVFLGFSFVFAQSQAMNGMLLRSASLKHQKSSLRLATVFFKALWPSFYLMLRGQIMWFGDCDFADFLQLLAAQFVQFEPKWLLAQSNTWLPRLLKRRHPKWMTGARRGVPRATVARRNRC
jgi:hypothetical protein